MTWSDKLLGISENTKERGRTYRKSSYQMRTKRSKIRDIKTQDQKWRIGLSTYWVMIGQEAVLYKPNKQLK